MESATVLTDLVGLVPDLALAGLVIFFVLRWRRDEHSRDREWREYLKARDQEWSDGLKRREEEWRESLKNRDQDWRDFLVVTYGEWKVTVERLEQVILQNTEAFAKFTVSTEVRDALIQALQEKQPQGAD